MLQLTPILLLLLLPPAGADEEHEPVGLADLSLEELLDLEVYSVSRVGEPIADAPAAVYVVTREEIRRNGVTSLPDALRGVPGLEVARIDANKWGTSARGSSSRFANKLLVLIDGRSIYTPIYAGVYWDMHDISLEDVERIEVIRGPGAPLWGANAVNGVINILTAPAAHTQGGVIVAAGGTAERGLISARHGGRLGKSADQQVVVQSMVDLPHRLEADAALRYVGALPHLGIDPYASLDLRLGWRPSPRLEIYLAGHDSLDAAHAAFRPDNLDIPLIEVERHAHLGMRWQF